MICHYVVVIIFRHLCGFAFVANKFELLTCFLSNLAKETIWCNEYNTVGKFFFSCWHVIILQVRWIWTFFDMFGFDSSRKHCGYRFFACGQCFICLFVWVFSRLHNVFCYVSFIICLNLCDKHVRKTFFALQNVFCTFWTIFVYL